jgi:hypothetical protein
MVGLVEDRKADRMVGPMVVHMAAPTMVQRVDPMVQTVGPMDCQKVDPMDCQMEGMGRSLVGRAGNRVYGHGMRQKKHRDDHSGVPIGPQNPLMAGGQYVRRS